MKLLLNNNNDDSDCETSLISDKVNIYYEKNAQLNNSTLNKHKYKFTLKIAVILDGKRIGNSFVTKTLSKSNHSLYSINLYIYNLPQSAI